MSERKETSSREVKSGYLAARGAASRAPRPGSPFLPPHHYSYETTHSHHYRYFKVRHPIKLKYRAIRRCEASITVI